MIQAARLLAVVRELSSALDAAEVMDIIRHTTRELTGADGVTFVLREGDSCYYAEEDAIEPLWKGKRFPLTACVSGWAMLHKMDVQIEDIYQDQRVPHDAYRPTFVKSMAMVPVHSDDPVAAIGAYWATRHKATDEEMEILHNIADAASVAITNVHLYAELKSRARQCEMLVQHAREETEQRQEADARFRMIFEASPLGIAIADIDGRLLLCNPAYWSIVGYPPEMIHELTGTMMVHPDDLKANMAQVERLRSGEISAFDIENRYRSRDGRSIWVHKYVSLLPGEAGRPPQILALITDINERKLAMEKAKKSQEHLALALAGADLGTWEMDIATGESVLNERWQKMLGYEPGELPANFETFKKLLHPDDEERVLADIKRHIDAGTEHSVEFRLQCKSGAYRWVLGRGKVLEWDKAGKPLRMFGTTLDITERHQLEDRVCQMQKMDAIGQLAGGVAHDFNNQLTGIMGYAGMIEDEAKEASILKYARNISELAKRSADLTRQLLAFSRKCEHRSVPVNIHATIGEVISVLRHTIDKRIEVRSNLNADAPTVLGDPTQLQSALLNIALNARDAMPEGGTLTFETGIEQIDEDDCRSVAFDLKPGWFLRVGIADTGGGMDAEVQKHIFEPFFTTKESGKGTGMGLAIVYGTVKQSHGAISVYSETGQGTTFCILLPLAGACTATQAANPVIALPQISGLHILVIDDEENLREVITAILDGEGCLVTTAADGPEAIAYYREHWQTIDLVIFDMVMPKLNGRDTFRELKKIHPGIRSILSSGFLVNGNAQELLSEGVRAFIQKPFTKGKLTETIEAALRP